MIRTTVMVALLSLISCAQYNDQCQPLVENPQDRVAFIKSEIYLDRPNARHANNAIGQQAADAFVWVFAQTDRAADFGVVNGGSIRAEGLCITRNIVSSGPLSNGVLHEIMLFENTVQAVDLSEAEVISMFEHSVERLFATPTPIVSPSGQFLQVSSNVKLNVDCSRAPGDRVTALSINGVTLTKPGRMVNEKRFRMASSSFVIAGGDGYSMLTNTGTDPARNLANAQRFGGVDSNIAAGYLVQAGANDSVDQGIAVDTSRITFTGCSVPSRPSN